MSWLVLSDMCDFWHYTFSAARLDTAIVSILPSRQRLEVIEQKRMRLVLFSLMKNPSFLSYVIFGCCGVKELKESALPLGGSRVTLSGGLVLAHILMLSDTVRRCNLLDRLILIIL
jgi:hypothetical protein